jgi:hypothetical protein
MRTDDASTSTITDLDARRIVVLNHTDRTYTSVTFDEMIAAMKTAGSGMTASNDQRQSAGNNSAADQVTFRFNVDRTNERQDVAGHAATRVFLTAEMEGEYTPEGSTERQKGGSLVVLTDMWTSSDVPAYRALSSFQDASAKEFANATSALMQGFAAAFADDPRLKVAFERSASEAKKIDGMAVRTVTTFVSVAPGQKFDRALAMGPAKQGPSVAQQAARGALGRLRSAASAAAASATGGSASGQQNQAQTADPNAPQATMFTVTSELRNISTTSLDASLFVPPAGYKELKQPPAGR